MKIHVGCGKRILEGWINCDKFPQPEGMPQPDLICDARSIPLPDACADEVLAVHVFEHLYRWESPAVLAEWRRLLKVGGKLVMEMPDLVKCCRNVLDLIGTGRFDQLGMWGLYGDPSWEDPAMTHEWGWTFRTIKPLLESCGFANVREEDTLWHKAGKRVRDFRVVAVAK